MESFVSPSQQQQQLDNNNINCKMKYTRKFTWSFDEDKAMTRFPPPPGAQFKYDLSELGRHLKGKVANVGAVTFPVTQCGKTVTIRFRAQVSERRAVYTAERYLRRIIDFETWKRITLRTASLSEFSFDQLVAARYSIGDLLHEDVLEEVIVVGTLPGGGKHIRLEFD